MASSFGSQTDGRIQSADTSEKSTEENIWTEKREYKKRRKKLRKK